MMEHQQPTVDDLIQALGDSIFAPETLQQVRDRIARIDSTACMCGDTPHENALHDLAHDDVPVLLRAIDRLAPQRITTVEQLDELPEGAVIHVPHKLTASSVEHRHGRWWPNRSTGPYRHAFRDELLPALLIWHPDWSRNE